jgi:hypothetical protein
MEAQIMKQPLWDQAGVLANLKIRNFLQVQKNRRHCAEAYDCMPHKRCRTDLSRL